LYLEVTEEYQDESDPEKYAIANESYNGKEAVEARLVALWNKCYEYRTVTDDGCFGKFKGLDQFLFRLYAQGVIVIMDESSVDVSYEGIK
jgi:hypothetical protein